MFAFIAWFRFVHSISVQMISSSSVSLVIGNRDKAYISYNRSGSLAHSVPYTYIYRMVLFSWCLDWINLLISSQSSSVAFFHLRCKPIWVTVELSSKPIFSCYLLNVDNHLVSLMSLYMSNYSAIAYFRVYLRVPFAYFGWVISGW